MKKIKECTICGDKDFKFLFQQRDKNLNFDKKFSLYKCEQCRSIFLNPQPLNKELEENYSSDRYYSLGKIKNKGESKKTQLKLMLYDIYFNSKKKNMVLKTLFFPLNFLIRGTKIEKGKKLLDIGSGTGQFLYEMKKLGMEVYGIEPGDFDKEEKKKYNLNIKNINLLKAKYQSEFFDIITMNHVLEHLKNPNENLIEIKRILKEKGIFIIGVPNSNSLAYWMFGKNWYQLDVPRHLWNYSDKNLKYLLEKNGFKIIKIKYNSRPKQFSVSIRYLLGIKNKKIERILDIIFLPLTWLVNLLKIGDQIEIWCERI